MSKEHNVVTPPSLKQQELLRFLELMQTRIEEVNAERLSLSIAVKTLEARLFALERQRDMMQNIKLQRGGKEEGMVFLFENKGRMEEQDEQERKDEQDDKLTPASNKDRWIHISQTANYPELPAPSTIREWIRKDKLSEDIHYKRLGIRNKVYVNADKLAAMLNAN